MYKKLARRLQIAWERTKFVACNLDVDITLMSIYINIFSHCLCCHYFMLRRNLDELESYVNIVPCYMRLLVPVISDFIPPSVKKFSGNVFYNEGLLVLDAKAHL